MRGENARVSPTVNHRIRRPGVAGLSGRLPLCCRKATALAFAGPRNPAPPGTTRREQVAGGAHGSRGAAPGPDLGVQLGFRSSDRVMATDTGRGWRRLAEAQGGIWAAAHGEAGQFGFRHHRSPSGSVLPSSPSAEASAARCAATRSAAYSRCSVVNCRPTDQAQYSRNCREVTSSSV